MPQLDYETPKPKPSWREPLRPYAAGVYMLALVILLLAACGHPSGLPVVVFLLVVITLLALASWVLFWDQVSKLWPVPQLDYESPRSRHYDIRHIILGFIVGLVVTAFLFWALIMFLRFQTGDPNL